jgi:hypothetical protein
MQAALQLDGSMMNAIKDINQARKGMFEARDFSANSDCMDHIQNYLLIVQSDVHHLASLLVIGSKVVNASDEALVLSITKVTTDEFMGEVPDMRTELNRLSGVCSKYPLAVAKALQSIELIDRAMTLVKSISKRL